MADEREIKLRAPESFVLPDLVGVIPGLRAVDRGRHQLDAVYWDTETLALQAGGFGLRYRTTDGKAGHWTLKARSRREGPAVVREEIDMDGDPGRPPARARAITDAAARGMELRPVAWLRTLRRSVDLVDAGGARLAEVADDAVSVLDGERVISSFREVEVELHGEPNRRMVESVLQRLSAAGAADVDPTPKYLRALRVLGYAVPAEEPG